MNLKRVAATTAAFVLCSAGPAMAFTAGSGPSTAETCKTSSLSCVDHTIREMDRRATPLVTSCDHDTIFSILYLRTTEEVRRALGDPTYFAPQPGFQDPAFVTREDAVFAEFYFFSFDNRHGRRANGAGTGNSVDPGSGIGAPVLGHTSPDDVPPAWHAAFDAADEQRVGGLGNALLGANAHIQRDLPFVLYRLGLGSKADHDKVNDVLERVADQVFAEMAARFDPSMAAGNLVPGTTLDNKAFLLTSIEAWRETAWRNAEALRDAPDDATRAQIAQNIEGESATSAALLEASFAYPPGPAGDVLRNSRNAYCAAHHFDAI